MRILIIEDEHRIATLIKKGLNQENFKADCAFTGTEGYELALSGEYDIILLDIMLPEMDGLTVCKKLREHSIHTPILMLTAKGQINDKVDGFNVGADDYLTKPFAFEELLARIRALSRRPSVREGDSIKVGDLVLNLKNFQAERKGIAISLSRKEFELLEYLLKNQDVIVSKEQIINRVWDYDADILPNTVEVYIRNLRNKIEKPFPDGKPLIQTIRGFGYKIGKQT